MSTLGVHFSSSIYCAILGLIESFDIPAPHSKSEHVIQGKPKDSNAFQFSITANVGLVRFHAHLVDEANSSLLLISTVGELDIQYVL